MGRKSNTKAKEKKLKHKQELAALTAKLAVIDAANMQEDPLATLVPFKKFERNGLNVFISCQKVGQLEDETKVWAFELTKSNMEDLYKSSGWGWNDKQKKEEMENEKAWYLVARNVSNNKPVAMVLFKFDLDFDEEVVYCYEVQLNDGVRRKGLGKFLIQILELLAHKTSMKKVMLTVFKDNFEALQFFKTKLKYEIDETSLEGVTYEILSKKMIPKQKQMTAAAASSCEPCCCHHHH